MTKNKKLSEIVIFAGSLKELNDKSPIKYEIAGDFFSGQIYNFDIDEKTKRELINLGFDGIIRANEKRFEPTSREEAGIISTVNEGYYIGLPIKIRVPVVSKPLTLTQK